MKKGKPLYQKLKERRKKHTYIKLKEIIEENAFYEGITHDDEGDLVYDTQFNLDGLILAILGAGYHTHKKPNKQNPQ